MFRMKEKTSEEDLRRSVLGVLRRWQGGPVAGVEKRRDQVPSKVRKYQGLVDGVKSFDFTPLNGQSLEG